MSTFMILLLRAWYRVPYFLAFVLLKRSELLFIVYTMFSLSYISRLSFCDFRTFSPEAACEVIEADKHSHVFYQAEPEIWMVMVRLPTSCQMIHFFHLTLSWGQYGHLNDQVACILRWRLSVWDRYICLRKLSIGLGFSLLIWAHGFVFYWGYICH